MTVRTPSDRCRAEASTTTARVPESIESAQVNNSTNVPAYVPACAAVGDVGREAPLLIVVGELEEHRASRYIPKPPTGGTERIRAISRPSGAAERTSDLGSPSRRPNVAQTTAVSRSHSGRLVPASSLLSLSPPLPVAKAD